MQRLLGTAWALGVPPLRGRRTVTGTSPVALPSAHSLPVAAPTPESKGAGWGNLKSEVTGMRPGDVNFQVL